MKIAIVILNWNGKQLLEQFLPAMINCTGNDAEIYIADNASTDDSVQFVKTNFPQVKIIQNTINGGYAKGYNDALQNIDADIYALVNSDIEVTNGWIKPIIDEFKDSENTAVIQPKILDFKNKTKFEYAGAAGGFIDFLGYPYCRGRIFSSLENEEEQYNDTTEIFWASGACFFIRSKVYHQLGGFDEQYFAHQEEIDLCWRVQNQDYTIKYVGTSIVYHVGGATLHEASPKKTFLNFRNSLFSIIKNIPKRYLFIVILSRLLLDGLAGTKFLFELKPLHTWAIIKAHFSFYWYLPTMLKKRNKILHKKTSYYHSKSIVWQHFMLGKKTFMTIG
ncbi:MAG: glycosyltransferase family 2 protein [Flavobacteriaceae bacterium]|nr:glycosyltransferase family 2 protein [Flavobacteriaceae bacterium]